ncbi:MAG: hypothetical protein ABI467_00725 [Kofleriaceae bacterium]
MKSLTLLVVVLAACSSNEPPASVQQTFFAQFGAVQSLQAQAVQAHSSLAPADGSVDFNGACPGGGTFASTGTYAGDGTVTNATFDLGMTFTACSAGGVTADGSWQWTAATSTTGATFTVDADVMVTGPQASGHFVDNLTMSFDLAARTFSITGTIEVDNKSYDVDWSYAG